MGTEKITGVDSSLPNRNEPRRVPTCGTDAWVLRYKKTIAAVWWVCILVMNSSGHAPG